MRKWSKKYLAMVAELAERAIESYEALVPRIRRPAVHEFEKYVALVDGKNRGCKIGDVEMYAPMRDPAQDLDASAARTRELVTRARELGASVVQIDMMGSVRIEWPVLPQPAEQVRN